MKRIIVLSIVVLSLFSCFHVMAADPDSNVSEIDASGLDVDSPPKNGYYSKGLIMFHNNFGEEYTEIADPIGQKMYITYSDSKGYIIHNATYYHSCEYKYYGTPDQLFTGGGDKHLSYGEPWNLRVLKGSFFVTNLPLFDEDDQESIDAYVDNGDVSGATNYDPDSFDESIEFPLGLKVTGGYATGLESAYDINKNFDFNWYQNADTSEYQYQIDISMEIGTVNKGNGKVSSTGSAILTGDTYSSGWVNFALNSYSGTNQISYSVPAAVMNDKLLEKCLEAYVNQTGNKITYKGYLVTKLQLRVRNLVGNGASDYVVITVDKNAVTTTAHVENKNGEVVEEEQYNDQSVVDAKDGYNIDNVEVTLSSILNFIRSGFGLFGDYGIISLMSKCYLYLPASFWSMLNFFVAMMVAVSVIKLIKSFIFG